MARRSLGTLTLDIVAQTGGFVQGMSKAERASERWRRQVQKDAEQIGRYIGVAGTAAAAAAGALVVSTTRAATEIGRLSAVSGIGAEEFQRYAAGAKLVGIEQDKLADIFKDTNDKLGDFFQTGAGPLADFFEQIAPKIGLTADAFRNLSGPQALELYVSSLQKAGVSQNEMTFYMEAIASDATMLLPLLKDNAAGFRELGDQAAAAGAILDSDTLRAANELQATMFLLEQTTGGMRNQIAKELLPVIADLATGFSDVATDGLLAEDVGRTLSGVIRGVAATAVGAFAALQLLGRGIGGFVAAASAAEFQWDDFLNPAFLIRRIFKNRDEVIGALNIVGDDLDETAQRYGQMLSKIWDAGSESGGSDGGERIKRVADLLQQMRSAAGGAAGTFRALNKEQQKIQEDIAKEISALERATLLWGMSAEEARVYSLELNGATEEQISYAQSLVDTVAGFEAGKKAQEDYLKLVQDLQTDEEKLASQMRERLAVLDAIKGITDEERAGVAARIAAAATTEAPEFDGLDPAVGGAFSELARIDEAEAKLASWYATQLEMLEQFRRERADLNATWDAEELALKQQHEDALAGIERARQVAQLSAAESVFGDLADMTKQFAGEQSGIYKALFAVEKAVSIARAIVAINTGIAEAAANPWPTNLAAMASVAAATAGIVSSIQSVRIAGMAHDGIDSVPKTGTWLLEKGERVVTSETSAKLDRTLEEIRRDRRSSGEINVNLIEDASRAGQVRQREDADGNRIIEVFVADLMSDGRTQQAISRKFGMRSVGA